MPKTFFHWLNILSMAMQWYTWLAVRENEEEFLPLGLPTLFETLEEGARSIGCRYSGVAPRMYSRGGSMPNLSFLSISFMLVKHFADAIRRLVFAWLLWLKPMQRKRTEARVVSLPVHIDPGSPAHPSIHGFVRSQPSVVLVLPPRYVQLSRLELQLSTLEQESLTDQVRSNRSRLLVKLRNEHRTSLGAKATIGIIHSDQVRLRCRFLDKLIMTLVEGML